MRVFLLKVCFFILGLLSWVDIQCVEPSEIHISTSINNTRANHFDCTLKSTIPDGWKLAKPPKVISNNDESQITITNSDQVTTLSKNNYESTFSLEFKDAPDNVDLCVEYFLCSDVCTIVTKDITIQLNSTFPQTNSSIWFFIFIGILGGLILNIMPCVLPVIFMKLRALKNADKSALLGSIVGNYTTFGLVALGLAILKISGETIGWGLHFQNIYFLEIITIIVFLLMLYSFGVIAVSPSMEISNTNYSAFVRNFISSIVTSIIAIPCTGPFLGTAAAFAIQGSISDMIVIFLAIATGFSAPYFISFISPKIVSFNLGKYSNIFKNIINTGIGLTFLWMFWLLASRISLIWIGVYLLAFALLWICFSKGFNKIAVGFCAVFCVIVVANDTSSIKSYSNVLQEVQTSVDKNEVVVFSISADWCLTCKYNNLRIFSNKEVSDIIKQYNVQVIHGDLTNKNDDLMKFIRSFGRVGIPFMIVYGPHAKSGILLNELPSVTDVTQAIKAAAGKK